MNRKIIIISFSVLIGIVILLLFLFNSDEPCLYEEIDVVIDTTHYGKVVFIFVKVESLDSVKIADTGKELRLNYASPDPDEEYLPTSIIAYFYRLKDTLSLTDSLIAILKLDHPRIGEAQKNVSYIKNGYVYRGLSKKTEKKFYIIDTISRGSFIVPKIGVRANEVFKNI
jgi:hypothetical protein